MVSIKVTFFVSQFWGQQETFRSPYQLYNVKAILISKILHYKPKKPCPEDYSPSLKSKARFEEREQQGSFSKGAGKFKSRPKPGLGGKELSPWGSDDEEDGCSSPLSQWHLLCPPRAWPLENTLKQILHLCPSTITIFSSKFSFDSASPSLSSSPSFLVIAKHPFTFLWLALCPPRAWWDPKTFLQLEHSNL